MSTPTACDAAGRVDPGPLYEACDDTKILVTGVGGGAWYGQVRVRDWTAGRTIRLRVRDRKDGPRLSAVCTVPP